MPAYEAGEDGGDDGGDLRGGLARGDGRAMGRLGGGRGTYVGVDVEALVVEHGGGELHHLG